jgi:NAD(P)-dependent dehydrogenase (short-subunit alcohol dehydrogenase family)
MSKSTERKVVIITGASRGIGASLVQGFRKRGYAVVGNSRTIGNADASPDSGIVFVEGDIAAADTADRVVKAAIERFGRIDTLVNNAGLFIPRPFIDYSEPDFMTMISVNLMGFFHMTQKVLARMLQAGVGHVVTITATIGEQPMHSLPAALATMTKAGLAAATRSLAVEYASRGIRLNAVSPGVIRTPMHRPETHGFLSGLAPMGRIGEPQDISDAVLYLEGAPFVTGEILHVDGGASAGQW